MVSLFRKLRQQRVCMQLLVGIVILASGMILGSGGTILYMKNRGLLFRGGPDRFTPEKIVEHFEEKYHLSPQQVEQVKLLFEEMGTRYREKFEKDRLQREADEKVMISKMQGILSLEQFAQWKQDFDELKKRRHDMYKRGRHGPRQPDPNRASSDHPPPPPSP